MPQPHLAQCAGALIAHGHDALIIDDGTVDAMDGAMGGEVAPLLETMLDATSPVDTPWKFVFSRQVRIQHRALASCLEYRVNRAIDSTLSGAFPPDLIILSAQRRKDVQGIHRLAQALRTQWPNLCIAVIGKMATRYGRQLMIACPAIDVSCVAMPESSIPSLAARLNERGAWHQIPGLLGRTPSHLHESPALTSMPLPANVSAAYHPKVYPALLEGGKFLLFTLSQSRGLRHVGHYHDGRGGALQVRAARQLRREMIELHELYGAQVFHVTGLQTPGESIVEFARECMSLPFPVSYSRDGHVLELQGVSPALLSRSGCVSLGFSLLTGSQMLLTEYFGEDWTMSDAVSCVRPCSEAGIHIHTDLVHPVPADDYHTRAETIRLLHRCQPDSLRLKLPGLVPGSAWHQHAAEFDFSLKQEHLNSWAGAPSPGMNACQEAAMLPFAISGRRGSAAAQLVEKFHSELEGFTPPIDSGCQAGLIARLSGRGDRQGTYIPELERATKTLDADLLRQMVDTFNCGATASINTSDVFRTSGTRQAVGD